MAFLKQTCSELRVHSLYGTVVIDWPAVFDTLGVITACGGEEIKGSEEVLLEEFQNLFNFVEQHLTFNKNLYCVSLILCQSYV